MAKLSSQAGYPGCWGFPQLAVRQATPASRASPQAQVTVSSQAGRQVNSANSSSPQVTGRQAVQQASVEDRALSQAENIVSWENNTPLASLAESTLSQADSVLSWAGISQAYPVEGTLSQADSALSQAGNPQASQAVRCSARLRALHASQADNAISQSDSRSNTSPNNNSQSGSNSQAGITRLASNTISQADGEASQPGSSQASASQVTSSASPQETRVPPSPKGKIMFLLLWRNLTQSG